MAKCRICGKPTREEHYKFCDECFKTEGSAPHKQTSSIRGLPPDYLKYGYFDEHGNLYPELIVKHAREIALALDRAKMKTAALRKFFAKVKASQRKLEIRKNFHAIVPEILELVPYVNNAVTRKVVPPIFRKFIESNVELAKQDRKAFCEGFVKHFEYIVAFFPREK